MAFRCCFTIFLFFCVLTKSTLARPHRPHTTLIEIRNDLPNTTHVQLVLSCDDVPSSSYLKLGHQYHQNLTVDQDSECTAMWLPWFATWDAYDSKRDKGHCAVYWSVKKDGFYHSWDGSKWKLLEFWYSE